MIHKHEILDAVKAAARAAWLVGHGRLDHDDCVSEANEAVTLAMRTFDPSKGCSLSTYAATRARWQARKLLNHHATNVSKSLTWFDARAARTPVPLAEAFDGIELQVVTLWFVWGYTYREIGSKMGISCYRVFEIMKRVRGRLSGTFE